MKQLLFLLTVSAAWSIQAYELQYIQEIKTSFVKEMNALMVEYADVFDGNEEVAEDRYFEGFLALPINFITVCSQFSGQSKKAGFIFGLWKLYLSLILLDFQEGQLKTRNGFNFWASKWESPEKKSLAEKKILDEFFALSPAIDNEKNYNIYDLVLNDICKRFSKSDIPAVDRLSYIETIDDEVFKETLVSYVTVIMVGSVERISRVLAKKQGRIYPNSDDATIAVNLIVNQCKSGALLFLDHLEESQLMLEANTETSKSVQKNQKKKRVVRKEKN